MVPGFEWDAAKRLQNLRKHGVDFLDAIGIFGGPVLETADTRRDYGETRTVAVGRVVGTALTVVYTSRGATRRLISARRSSQHEQEAFARFASAAPR